MTAVGIILGHSAATEGTPQSVVVQLDSVTFDPDPTGLDELLFTDDADGFAFAAVGTDTGEVTHHPE